MWSDSYSPSPRLSESNGTPMLLDEDSDFIESDHSDLEDEEGWEDVESDIEKLVFISLFDEETFASLDLMLEYIKHKWSFDFWKVRRDLALDFLGSVKLVNYIRSEVSKGNTTPDLGPEQTFLDEKYLQPVIVDDAVLFSLEDIDEQNGMKDSQEVKQLASNRIAELEEKLREAERTIEGLRVVSGRLLDSQADSFVPSASKRDLGEASYFNSYAYRDIHETMLKDRARTDAYRDFIYDNKHSFKDKVVLDVGCGTAILSMMCAKAGAKHVYAVDNSEIIDKARANVFQNGYSESITCIHGKIEDISLPVNQVDIIISEWMGYALLYEAMLDSVLWARDRWLTSGGLMIPCDMYLCIAPLSDSNLVMDKVAFWDDVYGFDMTSMQEGIFDEVLLMDCQESTVASNIKAERGHDFLHLDLYRIKSEDLEFSNMAFSAELDKDIDSLDGFVIWFDSIFGRLERSETVNELSTSPNRPYTHWMQTVLLINHLEPKSAHLQRGQIIKGTVGYKRPKHNNRQLVIEIEWAKVNGGEGGEGLSAHEEGKQEWKLE